MTAFIGRREFITLLGGAAVAWPLAARAQLPIKQPGKTPRLGLLMPGPAAHSAAISTHSTSDCTNSVTSMTRNLTMERRNADWKPDRLPALAAELVGLKADIIVAWSTPAARAAKLVTNSIPIVAAVMADPVGDELVVSLAQPGGNVTGTTFLGPELIAKRLQLLRDVVPGLARVAALWHPHAYGEHTMANIVKDIADAARTLDIQLQLVPADGPDDIASAFSTMAKERADAFIVMPSPMLFGEHRHIVELAADSRLRACIKRGNSWMPEVSCRTERTSTICSGAAPYMWTRYSRARSRRTCRSKRPTKFELVINLKTARGARPDVPPSLLARRRRGDRVSAPGKAGAIQPVEVRPK